MIPKPLKKLLKKQKALGLDRLCLRALAQRQG